MEKISSDHYKISPTSAMCAISRAKTGMPYAQEIADLVMTLSPESLGGLGDMLKIMEEGPLAKHPMRTMLEGRYLATNAALKEIGDPAMFELASGLSPRSLEFLSQDPSRFYAETMLPGELPLKTEIVKRIRDSRRETHPGNHYLLAVNACNFNEMEQVGALFKASKTTKPLAIIHEGLFMYLNPDEQAKTADNIHNFLSTYSPNGAWITPDLAIRSADMKRIPGIQDRMKEFEQKTGRPFTMFEKDEDVLAFGDMHGFKVKVRSADDVISQLKSVAAFGLDESRVKEVISGYRPYILTLK